MCHIVEESFSGYWELGLTLPCLGTVRSRPPCSSPPMSTQQIAASTIPRGCSGCHSDDPHQKLPDCRHGLWEQKSISETRCSLG